MKKPTVYLETSFLTNLADPLSRDPDIHHQQIIDTIIEKHGYQAPTIATPDQFLDSVEPPP